MDTARDEVEVAIAGSNTGIFEMRVGQESSIAVLVCSVFSWGLRWESAWDLSVSYGWPVSECAVVTTSKLIAVLNGSRHGTVSTSTSPQILWLVMNRYRGHSW